MKKKTFHSELYDVLDAYVHGVYDATQLFPKEELFGVTSQLRRASLSVMLNYTEGYAREGDKSKKHFYQIGYASLKEAMYLLDFSVKRGYLGEAEYNTLHQQAEKIAKMLWGTIKNM